MCRELIPSVLVPTATQEARERAGLQKPVKDGTNTQGISLCGRVW